MQMKASYAQNGSLLYSITSVSIKQWKGACICVTGIVGKGKCYQKRGAVSLAIEHAP